MNILPQNNPLVMALIVSTDEDPSLQMKLKLCNNKFTWCNYGKLWLRPHPAFAFKIRKDGNCGSRFIHIAVNYSQFLAFLIFLIKIFCENNFDTNDSDVNFILLQRRFDASCIIFK